jgi:hypothetical protein
VSVNSYIRIDEIYISLKRMNDIGDENFRADFHYRRVHYTIPNLVDERSFVLFY